MYTHRHDDDDGASWASMKASSSLSPKRTNIIIKIVFCTLIPFYFSYFFFAEIFGKTFHSIESMRERKKILKNINFVLFLVLTLNIHMYARRTVTPIMVHPDADMFMFVSSNGCLSAYIFQQKEIEMCVTSIQREKK